MRTKLNKEESGQALVELALALVMLCVFVFGIVDYGRAIYDVEVMKNLVGEGSSLASRGTPVSNAATTVANDAGSDLNIATYGCVVVTTVSGTPQALVTAQSATGGICGSNPSRIGCLQGQPGCPGGNSYATIPQAAINALAGEPANSYIAVTEVFYNFTAITPIPALLGNGVLPNQMYSVAYY